MAGDKGSGAILVTGAGAGIGAAVASSLVGAGRTVIGCDIDAQGLSVTAGALRGSGVFHPAQLDVTDDDAVEALVARSHLSALVHCAALFPPLAFADQTLDALDRIMAVNFRAAVALTLAARRAMPAGGSIIHFTSGAGLVALAQEPSQRDFALYGASKAALDRWVLGIAADALDEGLIVHLLTPGAFVATRGTAGVDAGSFREHGEIAASRVGEAAAWLALDRRIDLAGQRLRATDYGTVWG